jgi:hypothetical protein
MRSISPPRKTQQLKRNSAAAIRRELATLKRRIKRLVVELGTRGHITPDQARLALRVLGLRHE